MMNETLRLKAIEDYKILDSMPEKEFDDLTALAAFICGTPVSLITLLDSKRQWFKSHHGIPMTETPREYSFCEYAIQNPGEVVEVCDLSKDDRFKNNPLVANEPHVRFYAGAPLVNSDGYALGTICVLDAKESKLSDNQKKALECLANNVIAQLELRKTNFSIDKELKIANAKLREQNADLIKSNTELDRFVYSVSHDLRAPLLSMKGIIDITKMETEEELTTSHMMMLGCSITRLDNFIGEILDYSPNSRNEVENDTIDFKNMLNEITSDIKYLASDNHPIDIQTDIKEKATFCSDKRRVAIVLNKLISNSINYCNPAIENPFVKINVETYPGFSNIEVEDNGIGICEELHQKVFEMFYRGSEKSNGSGLGLYIVQETIQKLNGKISLQSQPGLGSKFSVTIPNLNYL